MIDRKRLTLIKLLAHGENYFMVYHMDLCWRQFFLIYIYLFNIFLNKIYVCNFDNNTAPSMCHKNFPELLEKLERNSEFAIHWCEDNYTILNTGKYYLLISGRKYEYQ